MLRVSNMTDNEIVVLLVVHGVVSLLYLLIAAKKNKSQAISEFVIVFAMPVFGWVFLLSIRLFEILRFRNEDPSYLYLDFKNNHPVLGDSMRREANIIPIEDALLLDDTKMKRALLTDAIKQNVLNNNNLLLRAVQDKDREVSHYAVSAVTNTIENLESRLFQLEKKLRKDPSNKDDLKQYADNMGDYLRIGFLDEISQKKSEKAYADILETLISLDATEGKYFIEKINYEMKLENYTKAEAFCEIFLEHFPDSEVPYILYIKLYRQLKDYRKMQEKVKQLKACPSRFTINALKIIRFWDGGEQHV